MGEGKFPSSTWTTLRIIKIRYESPRWNNWTTEEDEMHHEVIISTTLDSSNNKFILPVIPKAAAAEAAVHRMGNFPA